MREATSACCSIHACRERTLPAPLHRLPLTSLRELLLQLGTQLQLWHRSPVL